MNACSEGDMIRFGTFARTQRKCLNVRAAQICTLIKKFLQQHDASLPTSSGVRPSSNAHSDRSHSDACLQGQVGSIEASW